MDLKLNDRKALVTGSTRGIGRKIAEQLLKEGCCVGINGRDCGEIKTAVTELQDTFCENKVLGFRCDCTVEDAINELVWQVHQTWGILDILVCNVGSGRSVPLLAETLQEWRRVVDLNLFSMTTTIQYVLPLLKRSKEASIVLISSICGVEALGAPIAYSVAKAGVAALAGNLAAPLAKEGIRINAVSPGNIMFPGSVWEQKMVNNPEQVETMICREVPMGRFGTTEEIADAVAFLVSPRASFITGANLIVDGGQTRSY